MKKVAALAAAALLATAFAAPAEAGRRHRHHHDDFDTGDAIATAVVGAGLLALFAGASSKERRLKQDAAVGTCSEEAEFRSHGHVAQILNVGKSKGYWNVEGELEAEGGGSAGTFSCTVRNGRIYRMALNDQGS